MPLMLVVVGHAESEVQWRDTRGNSGYLPSSKLLGIDIPDVNGHFSVTHIFGPSDAPWYSMTISVDRMNDIPEGKNVQSSASNSSSDGTFIWTHPVTPGGPTMCVVYDAEGNFVQAYDVLKDENGQWAGCE